MVSRESRHNKLDLGMLAVDRDSHVSKTRFQNHLKGLNRQFEDIQGVEYMVL